MDLLAASLPTSELQMSLSAQPSPSASLHAGSIKNEHLTVSAPTTPTSDQSSSSLLASLAAPGSSDEKEERPSLSYKDLIIEAIESSPDKRLKLSEIYQVIRILHPYYRKRADQWGWQNSIRHNLSLHDCFVKLPLKQTSASGVVGHYWTVVRDSSEDKNGSSRRRNRSNKISRTTSSLKLSTAGPSSKIKDRQSVSSDSGVISDECMTPESNSPSTLLMENSRKESGLGFASIAQQAAAVAAFSRSTSLPSPLDANSVLQRLTLNALLENTQSPVSLTGNGSSNILDNPLVNEIQRFQLMNLYLQQQNNFSSLLDQSSNTGLLVQILLARLKDAAQTPPPVSTTSTPLELLSQLQNMQQPQSLDLTSLLVSMANSNTSTINSPSVSLPSSISLSNLLEQQLLNFNPATVAATSSPSASKDNLCVI